MRAYRIDSLGSVDGVVLGSRDDPRPATREILVRMRATSLNYRDLKATLTRRRAAGLLVGLARNQPADAEADIRGLALW
jgi:NADPH:quinone reductase-like Zn-dependent oxidoreductase